MTAFGFWVVAALSSQISGRPCTRSSRIGKSRRRSLASSGRLASPRSCGTTSGRNSNASSCEIADVVSRTFWVPWGVPISAPARLPEAGTFGSALALPRSASVGGTPGVEEGNPGTAGADCTLGTPGKENKSLDAGKDVAEPGYAAPPVSANAWDGPVGPVDGIPRASDPVLAGTAGVTDFTSWG